MDKTVGTKKSACPAWFQAQGSVWHKTMHDLCHESWIGGVFWLGLWGVVLGPGKVQRWGIFRKDFLPGFGGKFFPVEKNSRMRRPGYGQDTFLYVIEK
jgi:hypothetical protein